MCLLWQNEKKNHKEVVKMKQSHSGTRDVSPYDFLQNLLTRFCVFVPIELQEKTTTKFDDKEYKNHDTTSKSFFFPSLLEDKEPDSIFLGTSKGTHRCGSVRCATLGYTTTRLFVVIVNWRFQSQLLYVLRTW